MLHILWMLVKIILILLGIVLGLVVLALLLLLFCPVRYRADAVKEEGAVLKQTSATISVSWLFHGIWLRLFLREGELSPDIRILGIPLGKFLKRNQKKKAKAGFEKAAAEIEDIKEPAVKEPEKQETYRTSAEELEKTPGSEKKDTGKLPDGSVPLEEKKTGIFRKSWNKISGFWGKLKGIPHKIAVGLQKISLTIRNIYAKMDWWKQFLMHPKTREVIALVKIKLFHLLKHVFPTRIKGKVVFGSEDPSVTGAVLAVLGMTMPFHKNLIEISPVFNGSNVLEGNVQLKGRIYGIVLLKTAVDIYFNKNVKYVISRWKHKEG